MTHVLGGRPALRTMLFSVGALAVVGGSVLWAFPGQRPEFTVGLIVVFALAAWFHPVVDGVVSPYLPLVLVTVLFWRPAEVFLGVGLGTLIGVVGQGQPVWRAAPIALASAAPATVASAAVVLLTAHLPTVDPVIAVMLGLVPAAVIYRMLHTALVLRMRRERFDAGFLNDWRAALTANPSGQGTGLLLGALLAGIAQIHNDSLNLMVAAVAALALPLARQTMLAYQRNREMLEERVAATIARLDAANPGARAHAERVSALAVATGRRLDMPDQALELLRVAAWLHDVNILTDPREAVTAPAATAAATSWETPRTVRWLKSHPISELPNADIATLIGMYKERWIDRPTATPERPDLALAANILYAAELYDTTRSGLRPLPRPIPVEHLERLMTAHAGSTLDPVVVPALLDAAHDLAESGTSR